VIRLVDGTRITLVGFDHKVFWPGLGTAVTADAGAVCPEMVVPSVMGC
jgi:hypothetical protein